MFGKQPNNVLTFLISCSFSRTDMAFVRASSTVLDREVDADIVWWILILDTEGTRL